VELKQCEVFLPLMTQIQDIEIDNKKYLLPIADDV
jgi:hypothetical protein